MGIVFLGVFIVYIVITFIVMIVAVKLVPKGKWKWISAFLVILISILIPTWDIPIGIINYNNLCEKEAGQFIYKQVELGDKYFLKQGERNTRYSNPHAENYYAKGGELNLEKVKQDYLINTTFDRNHSRWGHIFMRETIISSKEGNKILSRAISFYYRGGWLVSRLMDGRAGGNYCPREAIATKNRPYSIHTNLPNMTFKERPNNGGLQ